ncbi:magnesium transporter CorA [Zafaria cholistanensis]|uniref:Magnesium transporter CorA n=1 Tax=Zafaria cholistanensis TaxID=1682741 RepID=A0A5A7NTF5_9MICC|nr:magnesium and cobalt transport protein CorA [Zafaria cholistanensis]GER24135.1 magnesium transporter CorA [Zafaria cholistanensis]
MPLVDNGVYVEGRRRATPSSLAETFEEMVACRGMAWLGLYRPTTEELDAVAEELGLHPLAIEDTLSGHQRPKLDRYGTHSFLVLRPARYLDATEKVEFGELHIYAGADFAVTIRQAESAQLSAVRKTMEEQPQLLAVGPQAVMYAVLDHVVDEYRPVIEGLANDIEEIEDELFTGDTSVSRRIYELSREVIEFQRAVTPLVGIVGELRRELTGSEPSPGSAGGHRTAPEADPGVLELDRRFADVQDHAIRVTERLASFRAVLTNALSLNATLVSQRAAQAGVEQNEQMKRISAWAAILFAPSLVGSIYGMNFHFMPELSWRFGYPAALMLMLGLCLGLYVVFKRNRWL